MTIYLSLHFRLSRTLLVTFVIFTDLLSPFPVRRIIRNCVTGRFHHSTNLSSDPTLGPHASQFLVVDLLFGPQVMANCLVNKLHSLEHCFCNLFIREVVREGLIVLAFAVTNNDLLFVCLLHDEYILSQLNLGKNRFWKK